MITDHLPFEADWISNYKDNKAYIVIQLQLLACYNK